MFWRAIARYLAISPGHDCDFVAVYFMIDTFVGSGLLLPLLEGRIRVICPFSGVLQSDAPYVVYSAALPIGRMHYHIFIV